MESETTISLHPTEQIGCSESENAWSHYQPDTFLLQQYFDDRRGKSGLGPEKRLMLAILEDALRCFQDNCAARKGKRKQLFDNVQSWFAETRSDWVFGFENICNVLGFSPEYLRTGLARWREKELSKYRSLPLMEKHRRSARAQLPVPRPECRPIFLRNDFAGMQRR
jgi:hypothetical protein